MVRKPYFRDGYLSNLERDLRSETTNVVMIYGDSGVGKSTLVNAALDRIDASDKVLRYSFINDGLPFKTYLNEVLFSGFARSSIFTKFFRKKFRMTSAHIEPVKKLSITFFNRAYDAPLNEKKSRPRGFVFESSHYRLNGTPNQEFFSRLWNHLLSSGVRYVNLTNIERADAASKELILLLVQTAPSEIRFILEFGIFGGNVGRYIDFETAVKAIVPRLIATRIEPLDEANAERLYKFVSSRNPHLPPFDYSSNKGNALAIIYDLSSIEARYRPSRVIAALMKRSATRQTLLLLAMLDGLLTAIKEFSTLAKGASIDFSLRELISTGVVNANESVVEFSHPYFSSHVRGGYSSEMRDLALKISARVKKSHPLVASYLLLRHVLSPGDKKAASEIAFLIDTLCDAMDRRDMHVLAVILPHVQRFKSHLTERQKIALHIIDIQCRIYNFRVDDSDFGTVAPITDSLCYLLQLQHLYHESRFLDAITLIDSETTKDHLKALAGRTELVAHFSQVALAIKAACEIGLGNWDQAQTQLAQVDRRLCIGKAAQYLEIFDGFIGGYEFEAKKPRSRSIGVEPYTAAKVLHNVIASAICLESRADRHATQIVSTLIPIFSETKSREITYCLNNLAVSLLLTNRPLEAIEVLDEMRAKTFETYDEICCELNSAVANLKISRAEQALRNATSAKQLVEDRNFSDPYFIGLMAYTFAIAHLCNGDDATAKTWLAQAQFPSAIAKREKRLVEKISSARVLVGTSPTAKQLEAILEPAVLHFWDFNVPLVDQETLKAFVWS